MKKFLFITGLLLALILLTSTEKAETNSIPKNIANEAVVHEKDETTDMKHRFEAICKDMRNSNGRTPRRHYQLTHYVSQIRALNNTVRLMQDTRVKELNVLLRTAEFTSHLQTVNYSAHLTRIGFRVFALRKIII